MGQLGLFMEEVDAIGKLSKCNLLQNSRQRGQPEVVVVVVSVSEKGGGALARVPRSVQGGGDVLEHGDWPRVKCGAVHHHHHHHHHQFSLVIVVHFDRMTRISDKYFALRCFDERSVY